MLFLTVKAHLLAVEAHLLAVEAYLLAVEAYLLAVEAHLLAVEGYLFQREVLLQLRKAVFLLNKDFGKTEKLGNVKERSIEKQYKNNYRLKTAIDLPAQCFFHKRSFHSGNV